MTTPTPTNTHDIFRRLDVIEGNLRLAYLADDTLETGPAVIDSCMENVRDMGMTEEDDSYWPTVYAMVLSEIDAAGFNTEGIAR